VQGPTWWHPQCQLHQIISIGQTRLAATHSGPGPANAHLICWKMHDIYIITTHHGILPGFHQQIELAPLTCKHGDSTWVSNCKVEIVGKAPKVNVKSVVVEVRRFSEWPNNNPCSNLLPSLCKLIVSVMSKEEPARMWDWLDLSSEMEVEIASKWMKTQF
jgi:hypothetical protein